MNKFNELRVNIFSYIGANTGKISKIPDRVYNMLRYKYHKKIPASFYLLFENIPKNSEFLKNILLTKYFSNNQDYNIVLADTKVFGPHYYVELNDEVYDVTIDAIIDKKFYELMFGVSNKKEAPKEKIMNYMKLCNMCNDDIYHCQDLPFEFLDDIQEQLDNYQGRRKELLERQVTSFFHDIKYEDGIMFLDIDHMHLN